MSTAFVLSGGASLGAIQVGMLRALYERGVRPDFIVGTSAGALNGAFVASRPQVPDTAEALGDIWRGLRRSEVFPLNPVTGFVGFFGRRNHLVPDSGLRRILERHLELERLEDAAVPLHVIAVDLYSGREVRLSDGPALDAVAASAAIPGVFEPVPWGSMDLVDGGVANNTPVSQAVELGADDVYILPAGHPCDLDEPPQGALGMVLHAMTLMIHRRLEFDIEALAGRARLHLLPPPCPLAVQPIDFGHADELIERSLHDARAYLDSGDTVVPAARPGVRPRLSGARPAPLAVRAA
jgi:NTE family protein